MATPEFLSCLSKQAMQRTAWANGVAPRNTGKETRAAVIAQVGTGSFVHPAALFPPTPKELEARRRPSSLVETCGEDADPEHRMIDEDDAGDGDAADGEDIDRITPEDAEPGKNDMSPADTGASGHQSAT